MHENDVAAFAFMCIFGLPTAGFVIIRMMQHRERMELIKHGMYQQPPPDPRWAQSMAPQQPPVPPARTAWVGDPQSQLRKGIATTCIGVALLIGLSFIGYDGYGAFRLGPWLLGGLIPMFVGIAQVINAVLSGATFPTGTSSTRPMGTPPPPPSSPPPRGPYTYRPGTTEELPRTKPPQNP